MEMSLIYLWLFFVFAIGVAVGSFLNVAIARLPMEKSLLWPESRCLSCLQPIRWYDNLPVLGYLWLRGRCRTCKARYSVKYVLVELFTGLGFVGLFYVEIVLNIHEFEGQFFWPTGQYPWQWRIVFGFHAILFSFLMVASVCDLDDRTIPVNLTLLGTAVGLVGATLMPWPWPYTPAQAIPQAGEMYQPGYEWLVPEAGLKAGAYPWPFWGPLPAWFHPGGNWQTGLATGLAGALVGTMMMRSVAFLASKGLGKEALGLGDADLMMMAGAFLGWQPVVVAFFVSVGPGLFFAIVQMIATRGKDQYLPFGPSLSVGIVVTMLCWKWIGPWLQPLLFFGRMLILVAALGAIIMFVASFMLRFSRAAEEDSGVASS